MRKFALAIAAPFALLSCTNGGGSEKKDSSMISTPAPTGDSNVLNGGDAQSNTGSNVNNGGTNMNSGNNMGGDSLGRQKK